MSSGKAKGVPDSANATVHSDPTAAAAKIKKVNKLKLKKRADKVKKKKRRQKERREEQLAKRGVQGSAATTDDKKDPAIVGGARCESMEEGRKRKKQKTSNPMATEGRGAATPQVKSTATATTKGVGHRRAAAAAAKGTEGRASIKPLVGVKRKRTTELNDAVAAQTKAKEQAKADTKLHKKIRKKSLPVGEEQDLDAETKALYVALDCEMVGTGPSGKTSVLAQVCLVDWDGQEVYNEYVRPQGRVTDFRTFVSGIKPEHLKRARDFREVQLEVAEILKNKVLVGHALENDLKALVLAHPKTLTRDTAHYRPFMRVQGKGGGKLKPRGLRKLVLEHLDMDIQGGRHDPAEDARAALKLYKMHRVGWEKSIKELRGGPKRRYVHH